MRVIKSPKSMQSLAHQWRASGESICLVPTMGALHNGHLALIKRGRKSADKLVVSIFVNPTQFGPREDFSRYPRTFSADKNKCLAADVDIIFCPAADSLYPPEYDTWVDSDRLASRWEGAARPAHFRGVLTIVLKLLNLVQPDTAIFGQKDYQQYVIIKRMVQDLHVPTRIVMHPTVREPDGLALSSRNAYLTPAQRRNADVLYRTLRWAEEQIEKGKDRPRTLIRHMTDVIELDSGFKVEYIAFADSQTLKPQTRVAPPTVVLLAATLGRTRFIDNILVK